MTNEEKKEEIKEVKVPTCAKKEYKIQHPHDSNKFLEDPYHWLSDKKNEEVISYINAENEFANYHEKTTKIHELKETLYKEFLARIKETDESVPYQNGGFLYYYRTVQGLDYPIYCRKVIKEKNGNDVTQVGEEEIVLDMNQIANGFSYSSLSIFEFSSDHSILAYGIDTNGDEKNDLFLLPLSNYKNNNNNNNNNNEEKKEESGENKVHRQRRGKLILKGISSSFEWSKENDIVYYTRVDHAMRPHQLWRHRITEEDLQPPVDDFCDLSSDKKDEDKDKNEDKKEEKDGEEKEIEKTKEEEKEGEGKEGGEEEEEEDDETNAEDEINKEDEMIYQEDDDRFSIGIGKTRDDRYFHLSISSQVTTEEYLLPTSTPLAPFQLVRKREQNVEYTVEIQGDLIFMLSNQNDRKNGFVLQSTLPSSLILPPYHIFHSSSFPLSPPHPLNPNYNKDNENNEKKEEIKKDKKEYFSEEEIYEKVEWKEVVEHDRYVRIESILPFHNYLVIPQRKNGLSQMQIIVHPSNSPLLSSFSSLENNFIEFKEESFEVYTTSNYQYDTEYLRLAYSSFITPRSIFDYNMRTHQLTLLKENEVKNYDRSLYHVERISTPASDDPSILIPISLTYRKDLINIQLNQEKQHGSPCLLYGYGAYEVPYDADFNSNLISLLDRGMIVAIAHIRGGGDLGRYWYEDGKLLKKKNTFFDFIAASQCLIDRHYAHPSSLSIYGPLSLSNLIIIIIIIIIKLLICNDQYDKANKIINIKNRSICRRIINWKCSQLRCSSLFCRCSSCCSYLF